MAHMTAQARDLRAQADRMDIAPNGLAVRDRYNSIARHRFDTVQRLRRELAEAYDAFAKMNWDPINASKDDGKLITYDIHEDVWRTVPSGANEKTHAYYRNGMRAGDLDPFGKPAMRIDLSA